MDADVIVAVATPWGEGGIGVVRLSGVGSLGIAAKFFFPAGGEGVEELPSHVLRYGLIRDGQEVIDEGLLLVMRAPRSYTREDVVEIQCHGGRVAVAKVLGAAIAAGAREAGPGEFTRRAFLNGRIDLAQAEAVLSLVRARGEGEHRASLGVLRGHLRESLGEVSRRIKELWVRAEGSINYPEEVEPPTPGELAIVAESLRELVARQARGAVNEGVRFVLLGPPNAGKSSLLNALLGYPRAIVSELPGTTRDTLEEGYRVSDVTLVLVDTAGVRETQDRLERLGVERSLASIEEAKYVLVVLDGAQTLGEEEKRLLRRVEGKEVLVILNKADLGMARTLRREVAGATNSARILEVSALTGDGMASLEAAILSLARKQEEAIPGILSSQRQRGCLDRAAAALESLATGSASGELAQELWPIDLREAWESLGEITGETVAPDMVEEIFSHFCLGK